MTRARFWLVINEDAERSPASALPDIIGDTSSAEALALVKKWISDCDTSHEDCRQETASLLPTGVLGQGGPDAESKIRLYETSNEPAKYMCLSYRWGSPELFKTEKQTLCSKPRD